MAGSSIPIANIGGCGKMLATWEANCEPPTIDCQANEHNVGSAQKCFEGLMHLEQVKHGENWREIFDYQF